MHKSIKKSDCPVEWLDHVIQNGSVIRCECGLLKGKVEGCPHKIDEVIVDKIYENRRTTKNPTTL